VNSMSDLFHEKIPLALPLATILGPLRHFILAHPKLLILCGEVFGVTLYRNSRRSCGNCMVRRLIASKFQK
jgi:hypothetical protein